MLTCMHRTKLQFSMDYKNLNFEKKWSTRVSLLLVGFTKYIKKIVRDLLHFSKLELHPLGPLLFFFQFLIFYPP